MLMLARRTTRCSRPRGAHGSTADGRGALLGDARLPPPPPGDSMERRRLERGVPLVAGSSDVRRGRHGERAVRGRGEEARGRASRQAQGSRAARQPREWTIRRSGSGCGRASASPRRPLPSHSLPSEEEAAMSSAHISTRVSVRPPSTSNRPPNPPHAPPPAQPHSAASPPRAPLWPPP